MNQKRRRVNTRTINELSNSAQNKRFCADAASIFRILGKYTVAIGNFMSSQNEDVEFSGPFNPSWLSHHRKFYTHSIYSGGETSRVNTLSANWPLQCIRNGTVYCKQTRYISRGAPRLNILAQLLPYVMQRCAVETKQFYNLQKSNTANTSHSWL